MNKDLYHYFLSLLSKQDYSGHRLRLKAKQWAFKRAIELNPEEIEETLEKLREMNYLNDERSRERLIQRCLMKKEGPELITRKLKQEGYSVDRWQSKQDKENMTQVILELIQQKFSQDKLKTTKDSKESQKYLYKIYQFCLRKGHQPQFIREACRIFSKTVNQNFNLEDTSFS